jgi:ubiquinone/menaquinone biosynthesis C-methylase UbiE
MELNSEMKWWENEGGIEFLKKVGIKPGWMLAEFGCRVGHYVIPAAKLVGQTGKVLAIDENSEALDTVRQRCRQENLDNVEIIETSGELEIPTEDFQLEAVLLYDVLHCIEDMETLVCEARRVLKDNGLLSVYPTHYEGANPKLHFQGVELETILNRIRNCGFEQKEHLCGKVSHFDHLKEDDIYNFVKT